jgi:histidinol-phosphate aminotransferase
MAQLEAGLRELRLDFIPSHGNFISVRINKGGSRDGVSIFNALLQKGVIVRPVTAYGMPDYIRVSIGLPQENQRFLDALAQVLGLAPDEGVS